MSDNESPNPAPPKKKRKASLDPRLSQVKRHSKEAFVFSEMSLKTSDYEEDNAGGFKNGETYDKLESITVDDVTFDINRLSVNQLRMLCRHFTLPGANFLRKVPLLLTLGKLKTLSTEQLPFAGTSRDDNRKNNTIKSLMESISSSCHEANALMREQLEADKLFKRDYLASTKKANDAKRDYWASNKQVNDAKAKKALAEERSARMEEWKSLKAMLQQGKDVIPAHEYEPLKRRADDLFQSLFGRYSS
ncbi:MAG: hypothetical protein SGBAC_011478 [Bacillariaceae sp.]